MWYLRVTLLFLSRISIVGCFFSSGESTTIFRDRPVTSSSSSWKVTSEIRSLNFTEPSSSVRIENVYGSHSTSTLPGSISRVVSCPGSRPYRKTGVGITEVSENSSRCRTSSGKTFVGEMAAAKAITEGRKAVFAERLEEFLGAGGQMEQLRILDGKGLRDR